MSRIAPLLFLLIVILIGTGQASTPDGFSVPEEGHQFSFPRDYGSHDDFKIEWWYITGHLFTKKGKRFGFEATFFRTAVKPPIKKREENDAIDFDDRTLFLADMTLLEVKKKKFLYQRRYNRRGWDASASAKRLDLHNGNWSLVMTDPVKISLSGSIRAEAALQLNLTPLKPLVIFGRNAVSKKGEDRNACSYYMTFPRLQVTGTLCYQDQKQEVHGEAWMDHEISSSQLGSQQIGWDWASLQLNDGREIMVYRMRHSDGTQDPFSTLTWIDSQGKLISYSAKEFSIEPLYFWKSSITNASYPVSMRLHTIDPATQKKVTFLLVPLSEDQELVGNIALSYWEGACRILNEEHREVGSAFLELTGYNNKFQKSLR
jgi:predicted secreted hydrolase